MSTKSLEAASLELRTVSSEEMLQRGEDVFKLVSEAQDELMGSEQLLSLLYGPNAVQRTPLQSQAGTEQWEHVDYYAKAEYRQPIGAFKIRGAFASCFRTLRDNPAVRTFVTNSAGNHGLGVAYFAKWYNENLLQVDEERLQALVYCAETASDTKLSGIEALGATAMRAGIPTLEAAGKAGKVRLEALNSGKEHPVAHFVQPFDDPDIMAGQSTILLELVEQLRVTGHNPADKPLIIRVAGGGFGLAGGVGVLMERLVQDGTLHPYSQVVVTQMKHCDSMSRALHRLDSGATCTDELFDADDPEDFDASADGTAVQKVGELNLPLVYKLRSMGRLRINKVEKSAVGLAMLKAAQRGYRLEPAGALPEAGRQSDQSLWAPYFLGNPDPQPYYDVVVESGRNRTDETHDEFVEAHTTKAGRTVLGMALGMHKPTL